MSTPTDALEATLALVGQRIFYNIGRWRDDNTAVLEAARLFTLARLVLEARAGIRRPAAA